MIVQLLQISFVYLFPSIDIFIFLHGVQRIFLFAWMVLLTFEWDFILDILGS